MLDLEVVRKNDTVSVCDYICWIDLQELLAQGDVNIHQYLPNLHEVNSCISIIFLIPTKKKHTHKHTHTTKKLST